MVTENGLVACRLQGKRVLNYDPRAADRAQLRARLLEVAARIQRQFPELQPTDDCSGRHADYTFDIGESQTVDPKVINDASAMAHELGARTTRSSVHLHLSFDPDDKASGSLRFINDQLQISPTRARRCFAFIGDSQNDAACFAAFKTTVGVANLRGQFSIPPRFITAAERSAGFVEAARVLFPAAFSQDRSEH
jgi:hydroxymethylpyrimidine pyrophosphatase-like HAD family hydrolase